VVLCAVYSHTWFITCRLPRRWSTSFPKPSHMQMCVDSRVTQVLLPNSRACTQNTCVVRCTMHVTAQRSQTCSSLAFASFIPLLSTRVRRIVARPPSRPASAQPCPQPAVRCLQSAFTPLYKSTDPSTDFVYVVTGALLTVGTRTRSGYNFIVWETGGRTGQEDEGCMRGV